MVGASTGFSGGVPTALDITAAAPTAEAVAAATAAAAAADDPHANCNTIEAEERTHLDLRVTKLVKLHF